MSTKSNCELCKNILSEKDRKNNWSTFAHKKGERPDQGRSYRPLCFKCKFGYEDDSDDNTSSAKEEEGDKQEEEPEESDDGYMKCVECGVKGEYFGDSYSERDVCNDCWEFDIFKKNYRSKRPPTTFVVFASTDGDNQYLLLNPKWFVKKARGYVKSALKTSEIDWSMESRQPYVWEVIRQECHATKEELEEARKSAMYKIVIIYEDY